jgi:hypothetical protein
MSGWLYMSRVRGIHESGLRRISIFLLIQLKTLLLNDHILVNHRILFYFPLTRVAIDYTTSQAYVFYTETAVLKSTGPMGKGNLSNAFAQRIVHQIAQGAGRSGM